ncbi:DUF1634 domain-containing protein, partial [Desulfofundulus sp.]|uniref:DUF1634 domain-containing protein n=1 Tax=Desulfofundulus sp. TaxID=2282750 RepID=UPI003C7793CB
YANVLLYGSWTGIALLVLVSILYMGGLVKPYIDPALIPQYWGLKASKFVQLAHMPTGWGWLKMLHYSDFLCFIGIAFLASLTVVGYLILLPAYVSKKDWPYALIVVTEVVVLVLAASGVLVMAGQ